jgi:hypothetical protein
LEVARFLTACSGMSGIGFRVSRPGIDWGGGGGGANTDRVTRGRVQEGDVPLPGRSAKLKLPLFCKVNRKLKRGPLQRYKNT